ncbi:MAG: hypothetical protein QOD50_2243 [Actinomycetota bacterium]|jgi:uncharacterized membrane protein HdeD (DUF308 family)|nr:hypothetical protein [Actinomycetota bacterium]
MTAVAATPTSTVRTAGSLRNLYFVRAVVSAVWVTLVFLLASTVTTGTRPTVIAVVLLTIYPAWDAVATFFDARVTAGATSHLPQYINIALGLIAAAGALIAIGGGLTPALIVFGVWASLSGAVQLYLALRRRRPIGGQWPMIISGGLSVLAGISFIVTSGAPKTSLTTLAGYSAFGAFWYLVGALLLIRAARRAK